MTRYPKVRRENRSAGTAIPELLTLRRGDAMRSDANLSHSRRPLQQKHEPNVSSGLVDALIEISQERAKILEAMKQALLDGDDAEVLERARQLTGLPPRKGFPGRMSQ